MTFRFTPLPPGPPGARLTLVIGINQRGNMVGVYFIRHVKHGFYLESAPSGEYVTLDFPGAGYTAPGGINDKGEISGYYGERDGGTVTAGDHGFVFRDCRFTTVDYPGAAGTRLLGINNAGDVIGYSVDPPGGFIHSGGQFRTITCPDGRPGVPHGINNKGHVVGSCGGSRAPFLLTKGGVSLIDFRAGLFADAPVVPFAINDRGDIAGAYFFKKVRHGFILTAGPAREFIEVDPEPGTILHGINNRGQIVGFGGHSFMGYPGAGVPARQ